MLDLHEGVLGEFAERQRLARCLDVWLACMWSRLAARLEVERQYYRDNKQRELEWDRQWRKRNKPKVNAANRRWKASNREHCADYFAAWQKANRERRNAYNRELRARRKVTA